MVRGMTRSLLWSLELRFEQDGWYRSSATVLADRLRELPFWSMLTYLRQRGQHGGALTPESFDRAMTDDRSSGWRAEVSEDGGDVLFELERDRSTLTLMLTLEADLMVAYASTLEGITATLLEALPDGVALPMSGIRPHYFPDLPWDK